MLNGEVLTAIQHAFSKPSMINSISKDATWYSIYQFTHCFILQASNYDAIFDLCVYSASLERHQSGTSS